MFRYNLGRLKTTVALVLSFVIISFGTISCNKGEKLDHIDPVNWQKRMVANVSDSLISGKTYLSAYSQIYSLSEHKTHNLTTTISMRNTSESDTIYIVRADFFDTHGELIRKYLSKPIFLIPLETVEIIIDEMDNQGGTGGNFIFEWKINARSSEPLFEGVMISTLGQQGLSFTTQGKKIRGE